MVARDRRNPMTEADRARVLRRLIEEELLIQQGQASGLLASNASVRRAVADSMIQSIAAERESEQPEDEDLLAYFRAHPGYFAPPESMHIRELVFRQRGVPGEELERASEASRALADGLDFAAVRARYCDEPSLPIPDAPLEWAELGQYLAPRDVQELVDLAPGGTSSLLPSPMGGVRILQLVSRTDGAPPLFAAVRRDVELAYRRDAADRALSDYLDWLWDSAVIEFGEAAPATDER